MDDSTAALIASTASASAQPRHAHETAEDASEAGRAKRSRRDRPCDNCRAKHQCDIPVRGEPCKTCKSRSKTCTFLDPPTARVRKPKADTPCIAVEQGPDNADPQHIEIPQRDPGRAPSEARTSTSSDSFAYARPSTTLSSVLSLVRNFVEQPPLPLAGPGQPQPTGPFLSPGGGRAELHYISAHAFSDLTFSVADEHVAAYSGDVGFRQVSADPALPAFFVQTPSLMYGTTAPSGRQLYEAACAALAPGAPQQLVEIFISQTQPAFPILDLHSFPSSDPAAAAQAGVSHGLLTSLLAHSTCYASPSLSRRRRRAPLTIHFIEQVHEIRPAHKHLWRQVLLSLEDEYRKPTLQTLQQALVVLASRPPLNLAQNHLAMGRLASAAQILGLHLDPTQWRIPRDERVLRKRLWWSVLITDKMRALWYGRPSNISRDSWNVSLPTLDDLNAAPDSLSAQSFIASCKLTVIIDSVLSDFFTVRSLASPRSPAARLRSIEQVGHELSVLEQELPAALRRLPGPNNRDSAPAPSGVRSFQLCKLGLETSLLRLATTALRRPSAQQLISTSRTALGLAQTLVEFLENLNTGDFGVFWAPYCSFIISAAAALLIRTALTASTLDPTTRTAAGVFFTRLVVCLTSSHHAFKWDVASLALDRIATLLRSLNGELPELVPLLQLFGPPNHASTGPPPPPPGPHVSQARSGPSPADPLSALTPPTLLLSPSAPPQSLAHFNTSSLRPAPPAASPAAAGPAAADQSSPALDAFWWMTTEILSLPDHLGAPLPDIFEGWPTFTDHDHAGATLGGAEHGGDGAGDFATGEGMLFDLRSFLEGPSAGAQPSRGGGAAGPAVDVAAAPDGT